jgi:hypothetical protein
MNYKSKKKLYANEYINRKNYERYEKKYYLQLSKHLQHRKVDPENFFLKWKPQTLKQMASSRKLRSRFQAGNCWMIRMIQVVQKE